MAQKSRALALTLVVAGCHPAMHFEPARPQARPSWHTLRAEHTVDIDVMLDGKVDHRRIRGVVAVERPGKLRLRALGPGGIALFDLVSVGGKTRVLSSLRDPSSDKLAPILASMVADLAASFLLEPAPPGRTVTVDKDTVVVREPERTARLGHFARINGHAVPLEADIETPRYRVHVVASGVEVDVALDPALFSD